jgi:hypothetical protein
MEFAASSGSILSLKSSCEENCELGGYLGNKVGYVLLNLPGTAQRFSPIRFITDKARRRLPASSHRMGCD